MAEGGFRYAMFCRTSRGSVAIQSLHAAGGDPEQSCHLLPAVAITWIAYRAGVVVLVWRTGSWNKRRTRARRESQEIGRAHV